jgi:hypothetical protein
VSEPEIAELRARVDALEKGFNVLVEVMSEGGGRLQALQAVVHALIVTNPNGAAFGPSLRNALEVAEANTLATSMNDIYLESMQATKAACLEDSAKIEVPDDTEQFTNALAGRILELWSAPIEQGHA